MKNKKLGKPFCLKCGYDLSNEDIKREKCPNCGLELNENNVGYLKNLRYFFRYFLFQRN